LTYCEAKKDEEKARQYGNIDMKKEHTEYRHHLDQSLHNTARQLHYPPVSFIM
jgi:hypothetical protein